MPKKASKTTIRSKPHEADLLALEYLSFIAGLIAQVSQKNVSADHSYDIRKAYGGLVEKLRALKEKNGNS